MEYYETLKRMKSIISPTWIELGNIMVTKMNLEYRDKYCRTLHKEAETCAFTETESRMVLSTG